MFKRNFLSNTKNQAKSESSSTSLVNYLYTCLPIINWKKITGLAFILLLAMANSAEGKKSNDVDPNYTNGELIDLVFLAKTEEARERFNDLKNKGHYIKAMKVLEHDILRDFASDLIFASSHGHADSQDIASIKIYRKAWKDSFEEILVMLRECHTPKEHKFLMKKGLEFAKAVVKFFPDDEMANKFISDNKNHKTSHSSYNSNGSKESTDNSLKPASLRM